MTSKPDTAGTWTVIEMLTADAPTVISQGGHKKEWTSVDRLVPPHVPLRKIIDAVMTENQPADLTFESKSGRVDRVIVQPITCPRDAVYGVQCWRGTPDQTPPEPRGVTGVFWDLERKVVVQPWESTRLSGREDDYHEEIPLARVLQLGNRYDQFSETLQLLFDPQTGQKTQTHVTVVHHKTGHRMTWQINIVAVPPIGVKVLWEDVTDACPPQDPTLHQLGMEAAAAAGLTVAAIAPSAGTFCLFLTPPPAWLPWELPNPGTKLIHPADQEKMLVFLSSDQFGRTDDMCNNLPVRLRSKSDEWVPVNMQITPMPGSIGSGIVITSFRNPSSS